MYILALVNFCQDPVLAKVLSIIKNVLDIIQLIGPIIGIIALAINLIKLMANPEDKKLKNVIRNWAISIVMLFLIPVIIDVSVTLLVSITNTENSNERFQLAACWESVDLNNSKEAKSNYYYNSDKKKTNFFAGTLANNSTIPGSTSSSSASSGSNATHTNSINNLTFNLYNQADPRWGSKKFSTCDDTIADSGCMLTSTAVVSSAYDKSVTPATVFDSRHRSSLPKDGINAFAGKLFSCSAGSASSSSIISALKQGKIVVIKVYGGNSSSTKPGSSKFTGSQHFMALIDISGDKIFVGNSYADYTYGQHGWFSANEVLTSVQTADYCTVK